MRRSLTLTPENDKKILLSKGIFLTGETPLDIDYTTMVNYFIELGHKVFSSMTINTPQVTIQNSDVWSIFFKYISSSDLKGEALIDQYSDLFMKKIFELWQKTTTQTTNQKPQPQTATQDSSAPTTNKAPEYVS